MRLKLYNISREGTIAHVALDTQFDNCVVVDLDDLEPHCLTGKLQPKIVFSGLVPAGLAFIQGAMR